MIAESYTRYRKGRIAIFTLAEKNLMTIYNTGTRLGLMAELGEMLGYVSVEETELRDMTLSVIKKLEHMSDAQYAALELSPDTMKGW